MRGRAQRSGNSLRSVADASQLDARPMATDFRPAALAVVAHRGASGVFPENTAVAFQEAIRLDVDAIELDVHLTADGELLVIHDPTVDRTSDGEGPVVLHTLSTRPSRTSSSARAGASSSPRALWSTS